MNPGNQIDPGVDQFGVRAVRRADRSRFLVAAGATLIMAVGAVACASDDGTSDADPADLSPAAQRGEQLSRSVGCAGCHGQDFGGGAGPSWVGLAGSEVTLVDGTTVVADDAYLTAAIAEPSKDLVDGYTLKMPANTLSDAEVADIVAYITTLADE
jgi:cytochrome c oxidase subunit 2